MFVPAGTFNYWQAWVFLIVFAASTQALGVYLAMKNPALLERIADWCDRYTPYVALDPPYGLLLDVTGAAQLFGGERALIDALSLTRVPLR